MLIRKYRFVIFLFLLTILVRIGVVLINMNNPSFSIQQDDYADYAQSLKDNTLYSSSDSRLFPGYPVLIYILSFIIPSTIISGFMISFFASVFSVLLFWHITKDKLASFLFAFFPPIWIMQATKVATEPLVTFILILSIWVYINKKFILTGIILGMAFNVRLIAIALLIAILIDIYQISKRVKLEVKIISGFILVALFLPIFNYFVFKEPFHQFILYPTMGRGSFGILQFAEDILRLLDRGQYRILLSGIFYLSISIFALYKLFMVRNLSFLNKIFFYWLLFSLIFIFSYGPTPLLEEYRRFITPLSPVIVFAISITIKDYINKKSNHAKRKN